MKRVYYIDTFSTGYLHEMFDAAALVMFAAMYNHVEYRTSRSSFEHVKALLGYIPENVSVAFIPTIEAYRGGKRLKFLLKQLQAVVYNSYYILTVPKGNDLVFNFNTLAALPMMNRCAFHIQNKVLQICHGELLELAQPASRNLLLRRGLQVFRSDRIAPELYFAVLGSSIYSHVAPFLSEACRSKLLQFEHPAIFPAKTLRHERYDGKLIFGTIGSMRESKGIAALLELAGMLKDNPQVVLLFVIPDGYFDAGAPSKGKPSEEYAELTARKMCAYVANGYLPGRDLILSYETKECQLSVPVIEMIIREFCM